MKTERTRRDCTHKFSLKSAARHISLVALLVLCTPAVMANTAASNMKFDVSIFEEAPDGNTVGVVLDTVKCEVSGEVWEVQTNGPPF